MMRRAHVLWRTLPVWLMLLVGLAACARNPEPTPTPAVQDVGRLSPSATPVPLEPWKSLRGRGLRPAQVERAIAVWTGSVLRVLAVGTLPSPCHRLRATVRPNTPPGLVELWLYVQPPDEDRACREEPTPFEAELAVQPPFLPVRVVLNEQNVLINR